MAMVHVKMHDVNDGAKESEGRLLSGIDCFTVVLSIVFILILGFWNVRARITETFYGFGATWQPSGAGLAFTVLLILINILSKVLINGRLLFQRRALVVVYVMTAVAGLVFSDALVTNLVVSMAALNNHRLVDPTRFKDYYSIVSPLVHIKDDDALLGFWAGGEGVPWDVWVVPLCMWILVFGAILFLIMVLMTLVRRMWTDIEHLRYPITIPIMSMMDGADDKGILAGDFWRTRLAYIGFIPPVIYGVMYILKGFFPGIPLLSMYNQIRSVGFLAQQPWNALTAHPIPLVIAWNFTTFGIGYLMPQDVTFSLWFFHWIALLQGVVLQAFGLFKYKELPHPVVQYLGGMVGLGLFTLWLSRNNMKVLLRTAFSDGSDENEALSSRMIVYGGLASIIFIICFCSMLLKIPVLVAILYFTLACCAIVSYARIRSEAGLPQGSTMMSLGENMSSVFGGKKVLGANTIGLGHFWCLEWAGFGSIGALALEGYHMGDDVGLKRRSVSKAMLIAYFVAAVVGFPIALNVIYTYGMFSCSNWMVHTGANSAFIGVANHLMGAERPFAPYVAVGSVFITGILYYLRVRYAWWPFHPIGWVMAGAPITTQLWFPFFVMWVVKWVILRYGGPRILEKLKPVFVGLIVGDVCMGVIGVIMDNVRVLLM